MSFETLIFIDNIGDTMDDMAWGFQKSYYSSPKLIGLQNCDLSKLEVQKSGVALVQLESGKSDLLNKISLEPKMSDFFTPYILTTGSFAAL